MAKKIVNVDGENSPKTVTSPPRSSVPFTAEPESKKKALNFRIIAAILWIIAIGLEVWAIFLLRQPPIKMTWIIVLMLVDLVFVVCGSMLWKKANRFDPASEKDKLKFFIQNQLGAIIGVIAFLPLVILLFTNKDMSGKQKGILGGIAIIAMLVAGISGVDFNPPSIEQYTKQISTVEELTGVNHVYWTASGTHYHLFSDCHTINKDATVQIYEGTVAKARELKNIVDLCSFCEKRAKKEASSAVSKDAIP